MREGVKKRDTHIEPKSYKLELLGKLVVLTSSIVSNPIIALPNFAHFSLRVLCCILGEGIWLAGDLTP